MGTRKWEMRNGEMRNGRKKWGRNEKWRNEKWGQPCSVENIYALTIITLWVNNRSMISLH